MSKYAGILAMGKKNYPSLVFDFLGLNNIEDYYREYKIPAEEKPVVYAYSGQFFSFRLEGSGTLITDEAIYFHPSHRDWAKSNRLPLSDICSYMVFRENDRDGVHLISQKKDIRIFGRTVAPTDTTATELSELLRALQKALIIGSAEKREFEKTLGLMLGRIRSSFHENGMLDEKYSMLLDQIAEYPAFVTEVAFIRAEHCYRQCNIIAYQKFLDTLPDGVDSQVVESLSHPERLFLDSFIHDISNSGTFYMTKFLIEPYVNLKSMERLDLGQCMILCFLCIRLDDEKYFNEIFDMISDYVEPDDYWRLVGFKAKFKNEKMSDIYEKLLSKIELSTQELSQVDSVGLTPLHYALITRDADIVRKVLYAYDWNNYYPLLIRDVFTKPVYDFAFCASCLYDDEELIGDVIVRTKPEAKPLARAIKSLTTSIEIKTRLLSKAENNKDYEDISLYREQIEEYTSMLDEVREELSRMVRQIIKVSRKKAEAIIKLNHPLNRYVLHLYMMPDALYRSIADTIYSWRIYRYKATFFVAACEHELDLSYYEWQKGAISDRLILESDIAAREDGSGGKSYTDGDTFVNPDRARREEAKRQKDEQERRREEAKRAARKARFREEAARVANDAPYGRSFFSPAAHSNINILKKEYRALIKRYHPDSGGDANDVEIMLVIMNERADILESIG